MHHSLLFWLFLSRAESQQFCLSGHLYSPESSPRVWGAKLRKVIFLGSLCSQLEDMGTSRRWLRFWGCHRTLWKTDVLSWAASKADKYPNFRALNWGPNFIKYKSCFCRVLAHVRWMRSTNQGIFPLTSIALPGARLLPTAGQLGQVASAAQQLTALQQPSPMPESHLCYRQSICSNFKKPSKHFCSCSFFFFFVLKQVSCKE